MKWFKRWLNRKLHDNIRIVCIQSLEAHRLFIKEGGTYNKENVSYLMGGYGVILSKIDLCDGLGKKGDQ